MAMTTLDDYQRVMALMTIEDHERAARFRAVLGEAQAAVGGSNFEVLLRAWGEETTISEVTKMIRTVNRIITVLDQQKAEEVPS